MLFLLINRMLINRATSGGVRAGFSQSMAKTGANDYNQSEDDDRGL